MGKYNIQRDRYSKAVDRTRKFPTGVMFESNTPPANALDIGATVANSAATGASIGGAIGGPVGAAVGGAAMGVYSLGSELVKRQKTISSNRTLDQQRKAYEMYGDKALDDKDQPLQAKKGLKANRYETVEMEKGEVHVDGETLETHVGTIPHEQGGNDVEVKPGDFIVNSQTDPEKRHKILALAEAAKSGSLAAKAMLQQEADKLPKGEVKPGQKMDKGWFLDRFKKKEETRYGFRDVVKDNPKAVDVSDLTGEDVYEVNDSDLDILKNSIYKEGGEINNNYLSYIDSKNRYVDVSVNTKEKKETVSKTTSDFANEKVKKVFYQLGITDPEEARKFAVSMTKDVEKQKQFRNAAIIQEQNYDDWSREGIIQGNVPKEEKYRHAAIGDKSIGPNAENWIKTTTSQEEVTTPVTTYKQSYYVPKSKITVKQHYELPEEEVKKEEKTKTETSDSPFRYTNVLYNTLRGLSGADKTTAVPLRLDRYKDKTDVEQQRQDILMQQKIMNRNADTAYTSKGESGSSKSMVSAQTTRSLAELNRSKYERSAAIQKANTDLANEEAKHNVQDTVRVNEGNQMAQKAQREHTGAASVELTQQKQQAIVDSKKDANDRLGMGLMNDIFDFKVNEKTGKVEYDGKTVDPNVAIRVKNMTKEASDLKFNLKDVNGRQAFAAYLKEKGRIEDYDALSLFIH